MLNYSSDLVAAGRMLRYFSVSIIILFAFYSTNCWNGLFLCSPTLAQGDTNRYDLSLLPIMPANYSRALLQQELNKSSTNAPSMFQTIQRASAHSQIPTAFKLLDIMRVKQPHNAVVQSGYCLVFTWIKGNFGPASYVYSLTNADYQHYDNALQQAYQIDPKLWMPYAIEGRDLTTLPDNDANEKGLELLRKAVELAPNISITHFLLGNAYTVYDTKFQSFNKAIEEMNKAEKLKPVMFSPALSLLDIYTIRVPNKAGALQAKTDFLATIPPNYKLSQDTLGLIAYSNKKFSTP